MTTCVTPAPEGLTVFAAIAPAATLPRNAKSTMPPIAKIMRLTMAFTSWKSQAK